MWLIAAAFRPLENTDRTIAARNRYREPHPAVVSKKMCNDRPPDVAIMTKAKKITSHDDRYDDDGDDDD